MYFKEGFRSFNTFNMSSLGQGAPKLLAAKVGGLEKSAAWPKDPILTL